MSPRSAREMRVVDRVKCRAGRRGSVLLRDCVKSKRGRTVRDRIPEVITFFFLAMFFLSFRNVVATHQTSFFAIECMIDQCLPVPYMTLMSVRSCSIFPSVVHRQIKPQSYPPKPFPPFQAGPHSTTSIVPNTQPTILL